VHAHTFIAPLSRFIPEQEGTEHSGHRIDDALVAYQNLELAGDNGQKLLTCKIVQGTASKRRIFTPTITSVKDIVSKINGSATQPIDLTRTRTITPSNLTELLKTVPLKYLRFAEDVRPPYVGTYSKVPLGQSIRKLPRKPFTRALPATNYDHDSEAEWEEPGEGEDLDSEGEEEIGDEDEGDDMREFLEDDDADKSGMKRRNVMGEVEPISTTLHWEGSAKQKGPRLVPYGETSLDLKTFRLEGLLGMDFSHRPYVDTLTNVVEFPWPLDPHSTSYWPSAGKATTGSQTTSMAPPSRIPLNIIQQSSNIPSVNSAVSSSKAPSQLQGLTSKKSVLSKPIAPELLEEFKKAIDGSDLTKAGLVEVLKKKFVSRVLLNTAIQAYKVNRFPMITKGAVQETIALVAERTGKKEADKRWRLLV
jgi:chromatin assembly factor 1 subunit A